MDSITEDGVAGKYENELRKRIWFQLPFIYFLNEFFDGCFLYCFVYRLVVHNKMNFLFSFKQLF